MTELLRRVEEKRKRLLMTKVEMAQYLGVTGAYYWRIVSTPEKTYQGNSLALNKKMAKFLGISIESAVRLAGKEAKEDADNKQAGTSETDSQCVS